MVERRELITVCRQTGDMMEAGVDILRITQVLRAQTENSRLLALYDALDHDLRMGCSIGDAMAHAPDIFTPFMVSLVHQGEMRNDLAGAFFKIADFLQKEQASELAFEPSAHDDGNGSASGPAQSVAGPSQRIVTSGTELMSLGALETLPDRLQIVVQTVAWRTLLFLSGLLLALAIVWGSVGLGLLERRWLNMVLCGVAALFCGGAGLWLRHRMSASIADSAPASVLAPVVQRGRVTPNVAAAGSDVSSSGVSASSVNSVGDRQQEDAELVDAPVEESGDEADEIDEYTDWAKLVEAEAPDAGSFQVTPAASSNSSPNLHRTSRPKGSSKRQDNGQRTQHNNDFFSASDEDEESYE